MNEAREELIGLVADLRNLRRAMTFAGFSAGPATLKIVDDAAFAIEILAKTNMPVFEDEEDAEMQIYHIWHGHSASNYAYHVVAKSEKAAVRMAIEEVGRDAAEHFRASFRPHDLGDKHKCVPGDEVVLKDTD